MDRTAKWLRGMLTLAAIVLLGGIPVGFALLGVLPLEQPTETDRVFRIAWALIVGGLAGAMVIVDLWIVEPWNFQRAHAKEVMHRRW